MLSTATTDRRRLVLPSQHLRPMRRAMSPCHRSAVDERRSSKGLVRRAWSPRSVAPPSCLEPLPPPPLPAARCGCTLCTCGMRGHAPLNLPQTASPSRPGSAASAGSPSPGAQYLVSRLHARFPLSECKVVPLMSLPRPPLQQPLEMHMCCSWPFRIACSSPSEAAAALAPGRPGTKKENGGATSSTGWQPREREGCGFL